MGRSPPTDTYRPRVIRHLRKLPGSGVPCRTVQAAGDLRSAAEGLLHTARSVGGSISASSSPPPTSALRPPRASYHAGWFSSPLTHGEASRRSWTWAQWRTLPPRSPHGPERCPRHLKQPHRRRIEPRYRPRSHPPRRPWRGHAASNCLGWNRWIAATGRPRMLRPVRPIRLM